MPANEQQNALEIAVIKEQVSGLREQAKAHQQVTKEQFDKMMGKLDEISKEVARIAAEVEEIKTSAKVGWRTIVAVGGGMVTVLGLAIGYFKG